MTQPSTCEFGAGTFTPMPVGADYSAFPSLTRTATGGLRMVWFQGGDHYAYGESLVMTATSDDDGAEWSPAEEVRIGKGFRDPGIAAVGDTLWLGHFTATGPDHPALGVYTRPSFDNGNTWHMARRVDPNLPYAAVSAPLRADGDGVLWQPFYGRLEEDGELESYDSSYLGRSMNGGATWSSLRINDGQADGRGYAEPWLVVTEGKLMVWHRYGGWDRIGITESTDGRTWVTRPLFEGTGKPAAIALSTGELVVVYRSVETRAALFAVSRDGGTSWDHGNVLLPNVPETQLGMVYAGMVEVGPGRVYVVAAMEDSPTAARLWHGQLVCS